MSKTQEPETDTLPNETIQGIELGEYIICPAPDESKVTAKENLQTLNIPGLPNLAFRYIPGPHNTLYVAEASFGHLLKYLLSQQNYHQVAGSQMEPEPLPAYELSDKSDCIMPLGESGDGH